MKKTTVYLHENTYVDSIGKYQLIYSPFSKNGPTVLDRASAFLFGLVDNKRTLWDIYQIAKKIDPNLSLSTVKQIFDDYEQTGITSFNTFTSKSFRDNGPKQLGVWLHITNQCNLRCRYCFVKKTPEKMNEEIADKTIAKIIEGSRKNQFDEIKVYFSGGEPLLELKKVINIVNFARKTAKRVGMKTNFIIVTNGVLVTPSVAQTLKTNNIEVGVSIDGLGKYNDTQRVFADGTGTFEYVKRGIDNLRTAGVNFNATVTITTNNIENLPSLTEYFLKNKIPFRFNFYRNIPFTKEGLKIQANNKKIIKFLKKSYRVIEKLLPKYSLINDILDTVSFKKPRQNACAVGKNYITITHKGELAACPMTIDHPFEKVEEKNLLLKIKGGNFIRPRNLTVDQKKGCFSCPWKYACGGGCPLLTFSQKGTYRSNSPYCEVYKGLIPEVLRLEAKRLIKYGFEKK